MATATLKVFLVEGDAKRLRTAELSNWTGKVVSGPRSDIEKVVHREEALSSGVYFLTGADPETNRAAIYIGEAESIKDRVKHHLSKDFWNNITFFISKDENLTKAHIKYLEGRLIDIARQTDRAIVMNVSSSGAKLPESDREDMEVFLEKMLQILPILGVEAFVDTAKASLEAVERNEMLTCSIKGLAATGYLTPNGMIVVKGSQAVVEDRPSAHRYGTQVKRLSLIEDGTLQSTDNALIFTKDVEFSSPSAAAAVIHGGSANGLIAWVNKAGVSLKQMQEI